MIPRYRAWNKYLNVMHEVDDILAISFEDKNICVQTIYFEEGLPDSRDVDYYEFDNIALMQSTGLTDKKDKEIFEGDILKTTDYFSSQYLVEYDLSKAMFVAQEIAAVLKGEPEPLCELLNKDFTVKIIGDIHTNPELVEVEQ
ncbi:YopX family protein [Streptococcus thermophilus]|uniref:YopX family protein n=1 Tax=Streptococcus thermophilus TaxID=1308 RepID=UPI003A802633